MKLFPTQDQETQSAWVSSHVLQIAHVRHERGEYDPVGCWSLLGSEWPSLVCTNFVFSNIRLVAWYWHWGYLLNGNWWTLQIRSIYVRQLIVKLYWHTTCNVFLPLSHASQSRVTHWTTDFLVPPSLHRPQKMKGFLQTNHRANSTSFCQVPLCSWALHSDWRNKADGGDGKPSRCPIQALWMLWEFFPMCVCTHTQNHSFELMKWHLTNHTFSPWLFSLFTWQEMVNIFHSRK
jgi:hypothetical protein